MHRLKVGVSVLGALLAFTVAVTVVDGPLWAALPGSVQDRFAALFVDAGSGTTAIQIKAVSNAAGALTANLQDRWYGAFADAGSGTTALQVVCLSGCTGVSASSAQVQQGRVQRDSATQLSLQRYTGTQITLNVAAACTELAIPASGPTLGTGGLSASTVYFLYAYSNAGTLTLETSTTGYAADATCGFAVKSGDVTRRLIAMLRTTGATQFADSATQRFLLNRDNRLRLGLANAFTTSPQTTSTSYVELDSGIRIETLVWANDLVDIGYSGTYSHTTGGGEIDSALTEDGIVTQLCGTRMNSGISGASHTTACVSRWVTTEGYHYYTLAGKIIVSGTGTWIGTNDDAAVAIRLGASVMG